LSFGLSSRPEPVVVPAPFGLSNGVWFKVKRGMRGLFGHEREGEAVVFLVRRPSTWYFRVTCRTGWMPSLVDEVI
jgi:hypothetical protein